jgi:hypothetical protein
VLREHARDSCGLAGCPDETIDIRIEVQARHAGRSSSGAAGVLCIVCTRFVSSAVDYPTVIPKVPSVSPEPRRKLPLRLPAHFDDTGAPVARTKRDLSFLCRRVVNGRRLGCFW